MAATLDVSLELDERFELVAIDANAWLETGSVENVMSCTVTRDSSSATIESASLEVYGDLPEGYYRAYWITVQNGVESREPVSTFLVMSPEVMHDGKTEKRSAKGYSPLMEAERSGPPAGWFVPSGEDAAKSAAAIIRDHCRAPVDEPGTSVALGDAFVADGSESWLDVAIALNSKAASHFELDQWGRVSIAPDSFGVTSAAHSYSEDSSTILLSGGLCNTADWYDVPNVVTVVWSSGSATKMGEAVNDDPGSPVSTVSRGYEVQYKETNSDKLPDNPTQSDVDSIAVEILEEKSNVPREISYEHPYDGGRLYDGVMLDFPSVDARGPAKVAWQAVKLKTGCTVEERASMNERLWTR